MTKRQANIYKSIKEAFEDADELQQHFSPEEICDIFETMKEQAYRSELTTIKQLAMLYALYRLC
jgi:hypothetical protein